MWVDSHCHLDFPGLVEDEQGVVGRARSAGVGMIVTIATRRQGWSEVEAIAERHAEVVCALGVHPHEAGAEGLESAHPLVEASRHPRVVAIGEAGLDYHYDRAPRDDQIRNFRAHIRAARETGLPLVVHTREADADTVAILEEELKEGTFEGVIHCFSSSRWLAERAIGMGFYLGIGGILTFKRSGEIRAIVRDMPLDRLLLETDAPYLAPVPYRGRTNEPAYIPVIGDHLARLRELPVEEIERSTTENFFRLFRRAAQLPAAVGCSRS